MRIFLLFVALLAGSLLIAAALTYPAWLLVGTVSVEPVHRVMHRVAMLIALVGLIVLTRRLGLANKEALGYALPRREFVRQLVVGWLCGIALMLPLTGLLLGLDIRLPRAEFNAQLSTWLALLGGGIVSGLAVAFIEETFFRGVLFRAVSRSSGVAAAIIAPSVLYAVVHFLDGRLRVPNESVTWVHGFAVLGKLFERYAEPLILIDSFAALFMLGILLAVVRLRTGNIAACIGLHAAGVAAIAVLREATQLNPEATYAPLVGSYNGVIGWAALVWFAVIAGMYAKMTRAARGR
jgi:hypothetical protein